MHAAAAAAAAAAAYIRASVAACVIDTVYQLIYSSARTQQRESKFRIEVSTCFGNPLRTSSGRCVPSQEDFYNTSIFLYENSIFHAWTKCTFGSVISIILVLIAGFLTLQKKWNDRCCFYSCVCTHTAVDLRTTAVSGYCTKFSTPGSE